MNAKELTAHVRDRCFDDGDCWRWKGAMSNGRTPTMTTKSTGAIGVRRALWKAIKGDIPAGKLVCASCGNMWCVKPGHLVVRDRSSVASEGTLRSPNRPARVAKMTKTMRAKSATTPEAIAAIRASDETCSVLAARHGISKQSVSEIRRGKRRASEGNPFAALFLMAANDSARRAA